MQRKWRRFWQRSSEAEQSLQVAADSGNWVKNVLPAAAAAGLLLSAMTNAQAAPDAGPTLAGSSPVSQSSTAAAMVPENAEKNISWQSGNANAQTAIHGMLPGKHSAAWPELVQQEVVAMPGQKNAGINKLQQNPGEVLPAVPLAVKSGSFAAAAVKERSRGLQNGSDTAADTRRVIRNQGEHPPWAVTVSRRDVQQEKSLSPVNSLVPSTGDNKGTADSTAVRIVGGAADNRAQSGSDAIRAESGNAEGITLQALRARGADWLVDKAGEPVSDNKGKITQQPSRELMVNGLAVTEGLKISADIAGQNQAVTADSGSRDLGENTGGLAAEGTTDLAVSGSMPLELAITAAGGDDGPVIKNGEEFSQYWTVYNGAVYGSGNRLMHAEQMEMAPQLAGVVTKQYDDAAATMALPAGKYSGSLRGEWETAALSAVSSGMLVIAPAPVMITAVAAGITWEDGILTATQLQANGLARSGISQASQLDGNNSAGTGKTVTVSNYQNHDDSKGKNSSHTLPKGGGIITSAELARGAAETVKASDAGKAAVLQSGQKLTITQYSNNDGTQGKNDTVQLRISKAQLIITAVSDSKTYDGTAASGAIPRISGLRGNDTASAVQEYSDKHAGSGKTIRIASYIVNDGNNGGKYEVQTIADSNGIIMPAELTVSATANTKPFDGDNSAKAQPLISGLMAGDTASAVEAYADSAAGTGKTLQISSVTVNDGNDGKDYRITTNESVNGIISERLAVDYESRHDKPEMSAPVSRTALEDSRLSAVSGRQEAGNVDVAERAGMASPELASSKMPAEQDSYETAAGESLEMSRPQTLLETTDSLGEGAVKENPVLQTLPETLASEVAAAGLERPVNSTTMMLYGLGGMNANSGQQQAIAAIRIGPSGTPAAVTTFSLFGSRVSFNRGLAGVMQVSFGSPEGEFYSALPLSGQLAVTAEGDEFVVSPGRIMLEDSSGLFNRRGNFSLTMADGQIVNYQVALYGDRLRITAIGTGGNMTPAPNTVKLIVALGLKTARDAMQLSDAQISQVEWRI